MQRTKMMRDKKEVLPKMAPMGSRMVLMAIRMALMGSKMEQMGIRMALIGMGDMRPRVGKRAITEISYPRKEPLQQQLV